MRQNQLYIHTKNLDLQRAARQRFSQSAGRAMQGRHITFSEMENILTINPDAVLLDVRDAEDFVDGHIVHAVNLPSDEIEQIKTLVKSKDTIVMLYCQSGERSNEAAKVLLKMGYRDIANLGGLDHYSGVLEQGMTPQQSNEFVWNEQDIF